MEEITTIAKIYLPLIIAFYLYIIIFASKERTQKTTEINNTAEAKPEKVLNSTLRVSLGFLSTDIPVKNILLAKSLALIIVSFSLTSYYFALDFSNFYPDKLNVTCHFDKHGIKELIKEIGVNEIEGLPIIFENKEYDNVLKEYITQADTFVQHYINHKSFFANPILLHLANLESKGHTTFNVKKKRGLHNYYIGKSAGELIHTLYRPNLTPIKVKQHFVKTSTQHDKIKLNLLSAIFGGKIIIAPVFNQSLATGATEIKLNHSIYCLTALTVMPYPTYSNTLYLYRKENKLYPVGYAVYIAERG